MKNDVSQIAQDWSIFVFMEDNAERHYLPVRAHNPKVEGSNPSPAIFFFLRGGVAQLARAFGSYPECQRFKSVRRYSQNSQRCGFFFIVLAAVLALRLFLCS